MGGKFSVGKCQLLKKVSGV